MSEAKNGKKRLAELSNKFHNAPTGAEKNDDKVTLIQYSNTPSFDFMEAQELERVELLLSKDFNTLGHKSVEARNVFVDWAIQIKTTLNQMQLFDIITSILGVEDFHVFFNNLPLHAKVFFKEGLKEIN